jgi:hypothetical protein
MITDCFGVQQWDLSCTETLFVRGVFVLVKMLIPVAMAVHTWKVCRTERSHERASVLGLERPSLIHQIEKG